MVRDKEHLKLRVSNDYLVQYKATPTEQINEHYHDVLECLLIESGNMHTLLNGKSYHLGPNTMLLFSNVDLHFNQIEPPGAISRRYLAYFRPEYIESISSSAAGLLECYYFRPFPDAQILPLGSITAERMMKTFDTIIAYTQDDVTDPYIREWRIKLLFGELLVMINEAYRKYHQITVTSSDGKNAEIFRVLKYMHANYKENMTLEELSKKFFINKFSLCKSFREVTGRSPKQYLINWRIMKAKELLMKNNTVEEVSLATGFKNLSHFSRLFKQHSGQSPKQFQKQHYITKPL